MCPDPSREKGLERGAPKGIRPLIQSTRRSIVQLSRGGIPQGNHFAFRISMSSSLDNAGAGTRSTERRVAAYVLDTVLDLAVR
jgi:hypothetical protein